MWARSSGWTPGAGPGRDRGPWRVPSVGYGALTLRVSPPSVKAMPPAKRSARKARRAPKARPATEARPSHVDAHGHARMVNVAAKDVTVREALARGRVFMHAKTLAVVRDNLAR